MKPGDLAHTQGSFVFGERSDALTGKYRWTSPVDVVLVLSIEHAERFRTCVGSDIVLRIMCPDGFVGILPYFDNIVEAL